MAGLDRTHALVWFTPDARIVDVNERFCRLFGDVEAGLNGQPVSRLTRPGQDGALDFSGALSKAIRGEASVTEGGATRKDDKPIWVSVTWCPMANPDGTVFRVLAIVTDLTEARTEARMTTDRLNSINANQAVIEFDNTGVIRHANDNFLRAVGYRLDEIKGKHHRIFMDRAEADHPDYAKFWRDLAAGQNKPGVYRRFAKGGKEIYIHAVYAPIRNAAGEQIGIIKNATDLTEQMAGIATLTDLVRGMADGDFSRRVNRSPGPEFDDLSAALNETIARMQDLVGQLDEASGAVSSTGSALASVAADMSGQADEQTSAIMATSSTLSSLSENTRATQANASAATQAAGEAAVHAKRGSGVAAEAVSAMDRIEERARAVVEVITVIESIAFQTNLLALNAAVEAARAGDAGKGFAVVASEVRTLAQRSAEAAKDIAGLINESAQSVDDGVRLVGQTGKALSDITASVDSVAARIVEIAEATKAQTTGIADIRAAFESLDRLSQRNRELANRSADFARTLDDQATGLVETVDHLKGRRPAEARYRAA